MKKKNSKLEETFETILFNTRFFAIIAVIFSTLAALMMFIKGAMSVIEGINEVYEIFIHHHGFAHDVKLAPIFISSVDSFLFATVLVIFSMGMYELFISKIDPAYRTDDVRPHWLNISSLDDLKGYLGKVILMILIVLFFERLIDLTIENTLDLLYLAISIGIISLALYLTHLQHKKE